MKFEWKWKTIHIKTIHLKMSTKWSPYSLKFKVHPWVTICISIPNNCPHIWESTGHVTLVAIPGTTTLVPYLQAKSLQPIWRLGRDLAAWQGTRIVIPAMATRWHTPFVDCYQLGESRYHHIQMYVMVSCLIWHQNHISGWTLYTLYMC